MNSTYYEQPVRRFPWTWSILRPQWRFCITGGPQLLIATDDNIIQFALTKEYEAQIRSELLDPEWPSEYWDRRLDNWDI